MRAGRTPNEPCLRNCFSFPVVYFARDAALLSTIHPFSFFVMNMMVTAYSLIRIRALRNVAFTNAGAPLR
jgi:hypothetical protein